MNQVKRRLSLCAGFAAVAAGFSSLLVATPAHADDSAYCQKVRARAAADSALLSAPSLRIEGVKLPSSIEQGGGLDATAQSGPQYQIRAGGAISLMGIYKGTQVVATADADCLQHSATVSAAELLTLAPDFGKLPALRSQVQYLDAHQSEWEAISAKMTERFASQSATLMNLEDVRTRALIIARQRAQLFGEMKRIEALGLENKRGDVATLIKTMQQTAMNYERQVSHTRSLDAWDVNLTGGYVPPTRSEDKSDFFAVIQFSYNLGGPWHTGAEGRYLRARDEELKNSRYELARQLRLFRDQVKAALLGATEELAVVEKNIAALRADRNSMQGSEASLAAYANSMVDLELISSEADQVYLQTYIRELSHVEEN